jgi:hypothetical protein
MKRKYDEAFRQACFHSPSPLLMLLPTNVWCIQCFVSCNPTVVTDPRLKNSIDILFPVQQFDSSLLNQQSKIFSELCSTQMALFQIIQALPYDAVPVNVRRKFFLCAMVRSACLLHHATTSLETLNSCSNLADAAQLFGDPSHRLFLFIDIQVNLICHC